MVLCYICPLKKKIYIFSGLGADERVFKRMNFGDADVNFIHYQIPLPSENLALYAQRMSLQITSNSPTLIGLSFGGMIATEVAKYIQTEKVIILASIKIRSEMPWYFKRIGQLRLHKLLPATIIKKSNFAIEWLFGTSSNVERKLLKQILLDTDAYFLKWAIDRIVFWDNQTIPPNLVHIHGTHDKVIPIRYVTCQYRINRGGHFMTLYQADELSQLIKKILEV